MTKRIVGVHDHRDHRFHTKTSSTPIAQAKPRGGGAKRNEVKKARDLTSGCLGGSQVEPNTAPASTFQQPFFVDRFTDRVAGGGNETTGGCTNAFAPVRSGSGSFAVNREQTVTVLEFVPYFGPTDQGVRLRVGIQLGNDTVDTLTGTSDKVVKFVLNQTIVGNARVARYEAYACNGPTLGFDFDVAASFFHEAPGANYTAFR